jgi:hypothetical protein
MWAINSKYPRVRPGATSRLIYAWRAHVLKKNSVSQLTGGAHDGRSDNMGPLLLIQGVAKAGLVNKACVDA